MSDVAVAPVRPALRYHGGKFRIASQIIRHFPPHRGYVEPFGGGGSILFAKLPAAIEVYNDLDGDVVNFFRVFREQPDDLIRAIQLTPWARDEQRLSFEPAEDPLERARRLYVRAWQTIGGPRTTWKSGWRRVKVPGANNSPDCLGNWSQTDHLWAVVERLKRVQIENDNALKVLRAYDSPDTLFYCDPPYVWDTRGRHWRKRAYHHEMSDDDHRELAECLRSVQGMVILSGYHSPLYAQLYVGWRTVEMCAKTEFNKETVEVLWFSPNVPAHQTSLFEVA